MYKGLLSKSSERKPELITPGDSADQTHYTFREETGCMDGISKEEAEAIFREYSAYVFRTALFLTKSATLAEDITQDTFLQVYRKYQSYDPTRPLAPWLYRIAVNITRNTLRQQKWVSLVKPLPACDKRDEIEEQVVRSELERELWHEVNQLTLKNREIIVLHYYLGFKLTEISGILGIPLGTCKSRLNSALTSLGKRIREGELDNKPEGGDICETF